MTQTYPWLVTHIFPPQRLLYSIREADTLLEKHSEKIIRIVGDFYDKLERMKKILQVNPKFIM